MRKYEIMYIIRPTVLEDDRKALIEELSAIFESNGSAVTNVDEWGMRELAYEIEDHKKGYYVVLEVQATDEARREFERVIRLKEDVIRHIIIKDEL
ncbi:MAG: 30S ribosomal protein S6 [Candidatus Izemoplasma sp.]|nr:30S ribosomal protein S6 [Candidatus Izemoplasma sp.]